MGIGIGDVPIGVAVDAGHPVNGQQFVNPAPVAPQLVPPVQQNFQPFVAAQVPGPVVLGYAPAQVPGPVPAYAPAQVPGPVVPGYAPAQVPGPVPAYAPAQVPGPVQAYAPVQVPGPVPAHVPVHVQGPFPAPVLVPPPIYAPGPVYGHVPAQVYHPPAAVPQVPVVAAAPAVHFGAGRLRECKFNGKIVDAGEKDGITYGSLMFQIESAIRQGYLDVDICAAIIKATTSKSLRGIMEAMPYATIADITPALKAHFTVKGVKSVFNELGRGKQETKENALQFCMRMIGLRHLVTRMNREENGEYTDQLIQSQFQYSLSTGLRGELRHVLRPTLTIPNIADNVLMKEITELMLSETEHAEKVVEKSVEVSAVGAQNQINSKREQKAEVKNLSAMQQRMDELDKELKMQQRVFSMLSLTPDQRRILASEHPAMLSPPGHGSSTFPQVNSTLDPAAQGYDPVNAVYRGSNRGGYQGVSGRGASVSRGNYRGGYARRGGYNNAGGPNNNRGGGNNYSGNLLNQLNSTASQTNNAAQLQNNQNNTTGNQNNTSSNVTSSVGSNPGYSTISNSSNISNNRNTQQQFSSGRGNFGGGRGSFRGGHNAWQGSSNVGCASCWSNNIPVCAHCFQCGESGHSARDCPLNC